jgi:hypothetical protein
MAGASSNTSKTTRLNLNTMKSKEKKENKGQINRISMTWLDILFETITKTNCTATV